MKTQRQIEASAPAPVRPSSVSKAARRHQVDPKQIEFGLVWQTPQHPFRLRVNDLLRVDGRMARVVRVTESAAVLLVNQPRRQFSTRFDKPVQFQPSPKLTRMSVNAEVEILYRKRP